MNCDTCKHCKVDEQWGEIKCMYLHRRVDPSEFEVTIKIRKNGQRVRISRCPYYEKVTR